MAGAFHTSAMAPAVDAFARAARQARFVPSAATLLGNADGAPVTGPDELRSRLITQIIAPVRWDLCAAAIARLAPGALHLELAPAGPLTRLLQRTDPDARTLAVRSPGDVLELAAPVQVAA